MAAPDDTVVPPSRQDAEGESGARPLPSMATVSETSGFGSQSSSAGALPAFATLAAHLRSGRFRSVALEPGSRVHHYVITGFLGRGGMSRVFEARHAYLGQSVALKTTLEEASGGDEFAERFLREARTLAVLKHPNVVRVFDANVWNDIPYVVTERLHGRSLADEVAACGPLTIDRALDVIEDVAGVFEMQEELEIIHRDIKPQNLYLRDDGTTCVFDYGLVGFTEKSRVISEPATAEGASRAGALIGTLMYMAPEQFAGHGVGPWTDVYGLGMTVLHALTGKQPRANLGPDEMRRHALTSLPPLRSVRPDASEGLERMVSTMLAPALADRYPSARDLLRDLCNLRYRGRRIQGVTRGRAFVAMPFHARFAPVWNCIEDASIDARLRPTRVDRLVYIDNIWSQIVQEIANSTVLIADFSVDWLSRCPNVNVVTEAAHAVALKRPLIVITQNAAESMPFDWRHVPVIRYARTQKGLRELRRVLTDRLQQVGRGARQA
jgi:serine/threonine protein kinase